MSGLAGAAFLMAIGLGAFVASCLLVFFLKRLFAWMSARGWISCPGHVPTYGTLGTSLLELQKLAQPQMEYVIEAIQEQEDKVEEDDEGGPDDPTRHLKK
jgi:hypothetical protein